MDEQTEETRALLRLSLCKGVSNGLIWSLLERFGSAREAERASRAAFRQVQGIGSATADALRAGPPQGALEREMDLMERHRVRLVPHFSHDYPAPLRHLDRDAPVLLRIKGRWLPEDELAVALVGSRRCSTYGANQARRMGSGLSAMGFTVVSGMARGIDSAAHRGALSAGGRTLAVLGWGLAHQMNDDEKELAAHIVEGGALVSELPMSVPPRASNFPPRNRLISGLSLGVVVVEAARRSGSLITARQAGEQGRGVFAVPGNVDSPTSHGCHDLIRDGAVLVENARDVVDGLGPLSHPVAVCEEKEHEQPPAPVTDPRSLSLNERERTVYEMLERNPMHIDEVVARSGLPPSVVSSTLMTLEIRGLISQLPGQRYARGS